MRESKQDSTQQATAHLKRQESDAAVDLLNSPAVSPVSALGWSIAPHSTQSQTRLLQLQRQYGNAYVQRLVQRSRQGEGDADAAPEVEAGIEQARGGGQPLDRTLQRQMESAFGSNFSGVRVHTDTNAHSLNEALSARAFTTGQDIFFRQGEYNPGSSGGKELVAHELTHVVQQSGEIQARGIQAKLTIGQPNDAYEQEADRVGHKIAQMIKTDSLPETTVARKSRVLPMERLDRSGAEPPKIPIPRLSVGSFLWDAASPTEHSAVPSKPMWRSDKSIYENNEIQDQNASLTSLTAHSGGVAIVVEAEGVYTSTEYPDGFKWTQTIDTNVPKGGTTSPYVDPRPNDDTKPFYYTDAEQVSLPTTFRDRPSRSIPATGTTHWNAILGLNGVNESTKTVKGFDYLTYGFSLDSTGKVTVNGPSSVGGSGHRSILASEFSAWTFT
jgi:Domain of unknown function (DUF4157)